MISIKKIAKNRVKSIVQKTKAIFFGLAIETRRAPKTAPTPSRAVKDPVNSSPVENFSMKSSGIKATKGRAKILKTKVFSECITEHWEQKGRGGTQF